MPVTLTNVRTKRKVNIREERYTPMVKAITATLAGGKEVGFTDLRTAVERRLKEFPGSVGWYLVTVMRDLEYKGKVVCRFEGKRPLYRLK